MRSWTWNVSVGSAAVLGLLSSGADAGPEGFDDERPPDAAEVIELDDGTEVSASAEFLIQTFHLDQQQATEQLQRERDTEELGLSVQAQYLNNPDFAGVWFDHATGGQLVVAATSEAVHSELEARTRSLGDAVRVELVDTPAYRLEALVEQFTRELDLSGAGLPYFSISSLPLENIVEVEVNTETPRELLNRLATLVEGTEDGALRVVTTAEELMQGGGDVCPDTGCTVRGGISIAGSSGGACSAGFTASARYAGQTQIGFLSSGHCDWPFQSEIFHGGVKIGAERMAQDAGSLDGSFIDMTAGAELAAKRGRIFTDANSLFPIQRVGTRSGTILGWIVCRSGQNSWGQFPTSQQSVCGVNTSKTSLRNGNVNLGRADDTGACPGDSGGPFYRERDNAALGLHQSSTIEAGCPASGIENSFFSFVSDANNIFHTTIDVV